MRELQRGRLGVALTQPKVGWEPDMVMRFIVGFLVDESGATSIEYGLVLGFVAMAILATLGALGVNVGSLFWSFTTDVQDAAS